MVVGGPPPDTRRTTRMGALSKALCQGWKPGRRCSQPERPRDPLPIGALVAANYELAQGLSISGPDPGFDQLPLGRPRPIAIRGGARRTGMQHGDHRGTRGRDAFCLFNGKRSHTHDPLRIKRVQDVDQVLVTGCLQSDPFAARQFVGRAILSAAFEKCERTVVDHEMLCEEPLWRDEALTKQPPQSRA